MWPISKKKIIQFKTDPDNKNDDDDSSQGH